MPISLIRTSTHTLLRAHRTLLPAGTLFKRAFSTIWDDDAAYLEPREMPKAAYYAVKAGRKPGIYHTWAEAEAQVKGFTAAKFKKFPTEAGAKAFISGKPYDPKSNGGPGTSRASTAKSSLGSNSRESSQASSRGRAESPPTSAKTADLPPNLAALAAKGYTFSRATPHRLVVYTDGSGLGNGKAGATAGAGVFWGPSGEAGRSNLAERVPGPLQTNNRGELLSIIRAIETCPFPDMPLEVRTDSQYSINCMTVFIHKWQANGWRTGAKSKRKGGAVEENVKNADMIRHLLVLLRRRKPTAAVRFKYVKGHAGHEGNEAADKLARAGAMHPPLPDRTDWLDPEAEEEVAKTEVADFEVDAEWLMDDDELAELELSLAQK